MRPQRRNYLDSHINSFRSGKSKKITSRKQVLFSQVAKTTSNLKLHKFLRNYPLSSCQSTKDSLHKNGHTNKIKPIDLQYVNTQHNDENNRSFSAFLRKKKIQNPYIKNKMQVFGNTLSQRNKTLIYKKIKDQIEKIDLNYDRQHLGLLTPPNSLGKNRQQQNVEKYKKFTICHIILQSYLNLLAKDPINLALKHKYSQIYKSIKEDMINILTQCPIKHTYEPFNQFSQKHCNNFLKNIREQRLPFFQLCQKKPDQLQLQIQTVISKLQNIIAEKFHYAHF